MNDTIRRQIVSAIVTALGSVRTSAGYATDIGATVYRARTAVDPDAAPFCNVFAGRDESSLTPYGMARNVMPVTVEAVSVFSDDDPAAAEDDLLGDIIEGMTGAVWTLAYNTGSSEIEVGDTITGATGKATAYVAGVTIASGAWADGDAAGTLTLRRMVKDFAAGEVLKIGTAVAAKADGAANGQHAVDRVTGGLAASIVYIDGGPANRANQDDALTGVSAVFEVTYETVAGNPYGQTAV
jgi:hypothetical protein